MAVLIRAHSRALYTVVRMPEANDPFNGTWKFNSARSQLTTPSPATWVRSIVATADEIRIREHIVTTDGSETVVLVQAKFDGRQYPVHGSRSIDSITYQRIDANTISGTGTKNGAVVITETVTLDSDNRAVTQNYSIHQGDRVLAKGVAVFDRAASLDNPS